MSFLSGLVSGAGGLVSGILGSHAAGSASSALQAGANQAANALKEGQGQALAAQNSATQQQTSNLQPFVNAGQDTLNSLLRYLSPGGALSSTSAPTFNAPTAAEVEATPGYQFQLQQGTNAINNAAAANGSLGSTGTAKNLINYASGLASTNYQNAFNNALNTYQTNFNANNTVQNNLYNRLFGISNQGATSGANLNSVLQAGAQNQGGIDMGTAEGLGQQYNNAAAARASGIMGSANAWQGALGNIFNNATNFLSQKFPVAA